MKIVIMILFVFSFLNLSAAEPDAVLSTRAMYFKIEDMIRKKDLYTVKFIINESDFSLAGFGKYNKKYAFYYRIEEGRVLSIAKIKLDYQISGSKYCEDYLFNEDGILLFAFIGRELENIEERFYFNMGELAAVMYDQPDASGKILRRILEKFTLKDTKRAEQVVAESQALLKFISEIPGGAALK